MSKMTELTPEQTAQFGALKDKWLEIGLATGPVNRTKAEAAVDDAYKAAGKAPPSIKIWLASPREGAYGAELVSSGQLGLFLRAQVWDQVRAQVRDQVGAQVWDQVGAQVRAQVGAQVWDQVGAQVRDQVGAQVWAQVRDQVGAQVRAQVGAQVYRAGYGAHDASWLGFYNFFEEACGLSVCKKLEPLAELSRNCGWWWPFEGAVILTEHPTAIKMDDASRLHAEGGPAIEYSDGFSVYSWHGTRVPEGWIKDKSSLTADIALTWDNVEQRRAACEILGWHNVLNELNARTLDKDEDPEIGELVEVDIPEIGRERFLRVLCATGREFALPVPPAMKTALEAQSWIHGGVPQEIIRQIEVTA